MNLTYLVKRPIITEKSLKLAGQHKYTFEVDPQASKNQIKTAVEKFFKVDVQAVYTLNVTGKMRRKRGRRGFYQTPNWKKAIVQLPKHQSIDLFETKEQPVEEKKGKKSSGAKDVKKAPTTSIKDQKPSATEKPQPAQAKPFAESLKEQLAKRIRRTTSK